MMKTIGLAALLFFMYPGKRQIILFYNDNGIAVKEAQLSMLYKDRKGLQERDLVIHSYKAKEQKEMTDKWKVTPDAAFTFILVGKDGGEKLRADTAVSLAQLYKTIDAMPMRRTEMREKK